MNENQIKRKKNLEFFFEFTSIYIMYVRKHNVWVDDDDDDGQNGRKIWIKKK